MMRTLQIAVLAALLGIVAPLTALAGSKGYFRASIGLGTQSLGDVNDDIEDDEQVWQSLGIPADFETLGPTLDVAAELGMMVSPTVSLGLGVGYQKNSADHGYSDFSGSMSNEINLRIIDVTANLSFWTPTSPSLFFGVNAGMGFGTAQDDFDFVIYGDPLNSFGLSGDWSGSGLVGGAFAGVQYQFPGGALLFGKVGYHYRNLGQFEGDVTDGFVTVSSPPEDNAGQPLDFDFSGVYTRVGLGFAFGG